MQREYPSFLIVELDECQIFLRKFASQNLLVFRMPRSQTQLRLHRKPLRIAPQAHTRLAHGATPRFNSLKNLQNNFSEIAIRFHILMCLLCLR